MRRLIVILVVLFAGPLLGEVAAPPGPAPIHRILLSPVEFRGMTTRDTLAPPQLNPARASREDEYKGPGEADPNNPQTWEVASYQFVPSFAIVPEGTSVVMSVFIVNGDHHEVTLTAADGQPLISKVTWEGGRSTRSISSRARSARTG